ncbi:hypothetical protein SAY87_031779 [Trapa incisa]|uniref:non-specific serine/threonine protein kinase n=1 Tax=Trapa incisa TaxID=236973 RepID=A0AAN7KYC6_9MYRT|nr:hypothetical protein SAY87_031779 [Trapa incisa]
MLMLKIYGLIFSISCCLVLIAAGGVTDPSEVSALQDVKSSLNDPLNHLRNWKGGDPCALNWTGVFCYETVDEDGYLHVRELQLLNMNLSGSLAPALGKLTHLVILDFMWNQLNGVIPKEIGNIATLKLLLLNGNHLSGVLPDELGHLSNLNRLQVDENYISGPIPKSFAKLKSLRHLHMNNNSISGQIPSELSNLSTLLHLLLDNNNLSGRLPSELSYLPNLRILQLDNNNFDGAEIPATYGNFSTLIKLSLRNCSLVGQIPDLSRIQDLRYVDLSRNRLFGHIPSNKLSDNMTTIDLSNNHLNGSIPPSIADLPTLQKLSLQNNTLAGSVPASLWQNRTFNASSKLTLDLQNNLLSTVAGQLNPPENITLRLGGNPVCSNANIPNVSRFCLYTDQGDGQLQNLTRPCPFDACPVDNNFEYIPSSPVPCYCASPLRIGYRLKSPSFSYFPPYVNLFTDYLTRSLKIELYQLSIDSFSWEAGGPRLRMYLKIFPSVNNHSHSFNATEVHQIRDIFASWDFPGTDLFGPYELLNFTLLGPYSNMVAPTQKSSKSKRIIVAITVAAIACVGLVSALLSFLLIRRTRIQSSLSRKHLSSKISMKIDGVKAFTFREMALATNNFNNSSKIGQGGYGKVYKGILSDHTQVAIKRAEEGSLQGQREFLTEIKLLSRLHHRNLVSLVGYCDEEEQMLVYEFMPNGSLRDWLSGKTKEYLNFGMRLRIALGAAKGILYLHTEANPPVFHRDIKASNILLDCKLTAKVADFGLSRLAPDINEGAVPHHVSTIVKGTPGYLDPEYFLTHKLTDKSDVYSLGVVFLELLTGMPPISRGKNIVREVNLANQSGMMFSIIDSKMGSYPSECIQKLVTLALMCCHDKTEKRPSMVDVVRELESILKMMPEADAMFSDTVSTFSHQSNVESSSYVSRERYPSSMVSGSDLISGVIPIITPR